MWRHSLAAAAIERLDVAVTPLLAGWDSSSTYPRVRHKRRDMASIDVRCDTGECRILADHDGGWYDTGDLAIPDGRGGINVNAHGHGPDSLPGYDTPVSTEGPVHHFRGLNSVAPELGAQPVQHLPSDAR
jgi:hypothetical protein